MKNILVLIIALAYSAYLFGSKHYVLNLFSHFQLQLAIIIIGISALLLFSYNKTAGLVGMIFGIGMLILISPLSLLSNTKSNPDLYFQNVLVDNQSPELVNEYVIKIKPRIVALVELPPIIEEELKGYYKNFAGGGIGGRRCGIFSDTDFSVVEYDNFDYPVCSVKFDDFELLVIHPSPPFSAEQHHRQQKHFKDIKLILDQLEARGEKFILVGDFNAAGFSPDFRKHFGKYLQTNYYTWQPLKPYSIPIDHALANFEIQIGRGPELGSDHAGLFISF